MRNGFTIVLMVTVLFAGGYFYNLAQAICPVPLPYRIGTLDERFGLTLDEAKVAVAQAAEVWESATGKNLFTYDDTAGFTINFIYDDRQAFRKEERDFESRLNAAKNLNDALTQTYNRLIGEYEEIKTTYERRSAAYDARFAAYDADVQRYNEEGGAPPEVYDALETERLVLQAERQEINAFVAELNRLVDEINALGDRGNHLIENYNENVGEFNEQFASEAREFTQGDYSNGRINIYTYADTYELNTVLAHELGHAMTLDHAEGENSVMYFLIGGQPTQLVLSEEDVAEFNRVCGDMTLWDKIVYRLSDN